MTYLLVGSLVLAVLIVWVAWSCVRAGDEVGER